ncbi:MAG TPA: peptidase C15, partial [Cyanobacteria bacterium UBA11149]|nr:peptidase C15 [Cyanobacteria bacterium UBA11149]
MTSKILLTSFQTWLPHQKSNSSDDLLSHLEKLEFPGIGLSFLRKLPVDVEIAKDLTIAKIQAIGPDAIICCGMAESRTRLTVESGANSYYRSSNFDPVTFTEIESKSDGIFLKTSVNLEKLVAGLGVTEISDNAGKFVCEGLYYQVLNYLRSRSLHIRCIFVHVPLLTPANLSDIITDFCQIIEKLLVIAVDIAILN